MTFVEKVKKMFGVWTPPTQASQSISSEAAVVDSHDLNTIDVVQPNIPEGTNAVVQAANQEKAPVQPTSFEQELNFFISLAKETPLQFFLCISPPPIFVCFILICIMVLAFMILNPYQKHSNIVAAGLMLFVSPTITAVAYMGFFYPLKACFTYVGWYSQPQIDYVVVALSLALGVFPLALLWWKKFGYIGSKCLRYGTFPLTMSLLVYNFAKEVGGSDPYDCFYYASLAWCGSICFSVLFTVSFPVPPLPFLVLYSPFPFSCQQTQRTRSV